MNSGELVKWVVARVKEELEIVNKGDRTTFLKAFQNNPAGIRSQISNCTQYWIELATAETGKTVTIPDIKAFQEKVFRALEHALAEQIKALTT